MSLVIATILLAAGQSRRFGAGNKLVQRVDGTPMVVTTVKAYLASKVSRVVVVTNSISTEVEHHLEAELTPAELNKIAFVENHSAPDGMAGSIRTGVETLQVEHGALIALADMPHVKTTTIDALVSAATDLTNSISNQKTSDKDSIHPFSSHPATSAQIIQPVYNNSPGNPVLFMRSQFCTLAALTGDTGAKALIHNNPSLTHRLNVDDAGILNDYDVPEDFFSRR